MTLVSRPIVSLADLPLEQFEQGALYKGADAAFGALLGLKGLGVRYNEVPAGKSSCPFHNHHVADEMFVILDGEGTYRFGSESHAFKAGDVLGAPAGGRETAHQITNTGVGMLRYLGISTTASTEVCEYPDSGKFLVSSVPSGTPSDKVSDTKIRHVGRADEHSLDYWDGEPGA